MERFQVEYHKRKQVWEKKKGPITPTVAWKIWEDAKAASAAVSSYAPIEVDTVLREETRVAEEQKTLALVATLRRSVKVLKVSTILATIAPHTLTFGPNRRTRKS